MEAASYSPGPTGPERAILKNIRKTARLGLGLILAGLITIPAPAYAKKPGYSEFIIDRNTGKTLHAKNADTLRYPASLTKMMTLYVVFDLIEAGRLSYKTKLRVTKNAAAQQPSKLGLKPGAKISVRTAIRALVTKSANDVAVTVAENLAGTEAKFARIMTWKARQIGMKRTIFRNASGLPDKRQLTTARDMAILGERLMSDFPKHYRFFRTRSFAYKGRSYRNHNSLLHNYSGTDGIKTGYTRASGFNLVASVKRGKKHLIGVVMGGKTSRRRNASMRSILSRAFKKASTRKTRKAQSNIKRTRIPTPMIARLRPRNNGSRPDNSRSRSRHQLTSTQTAFSASAPQPVLKHPPVIRPNHAHTARAAPPPSRPGSKSAYRSESGGFHIQIGAYRTKGEAELKIMEVSHRLGGQLGGHRALTQSFLLNNKKQFYRARFAGFNRNTALSACSKVRAARFDCIVMRAK